jgi:hypothetical protein
MDSRIKALIVLLFVLVATPLYGKALYVDAATGNDATTYANNGTGAKWATIGRAAWGSTDRATPSTSQAAQAGDTVYITAGTYATAGPNSRYNPAYNPVNSGTIDNPITFEALGTVTLTLSSSVGAVIGAYQKDYIIWKGFTIDEANAISASDTGPVVFWESHNSQVLNCIITGRGDIARGDNYTGVRTEYAQNITIKNNRISNFGPTEGHNSACIMTYYSGGLLIENNEISGCGSAVFFKANTNSAYPDANGHRTWNKVRLNYIHDCPGGVNFYRSQETDQLQTVTQNIFKNITNVEGAVSTAPFEYGDSYGEPNNVKVVNNTIIDSLYAFHLGNASINTDNSYWNNIVYKSSSTGSIIRISSQNNTYGAIAVAKNDFEHNLYYNSPNQITGESVGDVSLATWKATYSQDSASPAASTSDPLFTNAGTGDYTLQGGSPALTLGVDILDLDSDGSTTDTVPAGAYITGSETIGIAATGSPITSTGHLRLINQ